MTVFSSGILDTTATMRFSTPKTKVSKEPMKMIAVAGCSLSKGHCMGRGML